MMTTRRTRRDALKLLGAGAAAATGCIAGASNGHADDDAGVPGLEYFSLADVRLGAGAFLDAQDLDAAYLLRLEPDRLLHNFRVNAGLPPRAEVYGGWESVEPWIEIRCHGHTLGHYLTAAACMFETTGDSRFGEHVDYIVAELAECQARTGGWLTAFPDKAAPLLDSLAGKPFAGVPWYTTHKVLAGLRDAHLHRGSRVALDVWTKFSDWIDTHSRDVPYADFQKMLDREHGGMNEVCADLFAITGEKRHLALASRFSHRALLDPLARGSDKLDGLHANTQIPKVIGFARLAHVQGNQGTELGEAADFFWRTVTQQRSFATGGHGDVEHFFPKTEFARHLDSAKTMETCCTHNMLRLTRELYRARPASRFFDYYELGLFNGILASQDPSSGMMTYFQSTRPGYVKLFHTPFDSFWCCTGSGMENHARYSESIYARRADALYVNLYIASKLEWRERGLEVVQETRFPDEDITRLSFTAKPQDLMLFIRQPAWCPVMTLTFNGRRKKVAKRPGEYVEFRSRIRSGDRLEVHLPMSLRLEALPNASEHAAVMYGPIVLAGLVGKPVDAGAQLIVNERKSGEMLNDPVAIPAWRRPLAELTTHFTRTDTRNLAFLAAGFEGGPVKFIPWYRVARERYNLYWHTTPRA